ncbi:hypothetical protein QEG73_01160 [Chitinophagaceae bacterium 26-R-25]|nr:hypothetical protein [Chitinophagaceae bacterium 26-R-25]
MSKKYEKIMQDFTIDEINEIVSVFEEAKSKVSGLKEDFPSPFNYINRMLDAQPILNILQPFLEINETLENYTKDRVRLSRNINALAEKGWYLSLRIIDKLGITNLENKLLDNQILFEDTVTSLFEKNLKEIEKSLIRSFPKRESFIKKMVNLHELQKYEISIPIALIQADGMCKDIFYTIKDGKKRPIGFFDLKRKNKKNPSVQALAEICESDPASVLSILTRQLAAFDRNEHVLMQSNTLKLSDINRHAILHGESIEYGTYINSVKAILLLDFILELSIIRSSNN